MRDKSKIRDKIHNKRKLRQVDDMKTCICHLQNKKCQQCCNMDTFTFTARSDRKGASLFFITSDSYFYSSISATSRSFVVANINQIKQTLAALHNRCRIMGKQCPRKTYIAFTSKKKVHGNSCEKYDRRCQRVFRAQYHRSSQPKQENSS